LQRLLGDVLVPKQFAFLSPAMYDAERLLVIKPGYGGSRKLISMNGDGALRGPTHCRNGNDAFSVEAGDRLDGVAERTSHLRPDSSTGRCRRRAALCPASRGGR
jgi:hypothetical protein